MDKKQRSIIPPSKIYWLSYKIEVRAGKAFIIEATAARKDGKRLTWQGEDCTAQIFETLNNNGAAVVWVWNMEEFGSFCDYYALSRGMTAWQNAAKQKSGNGAAEECYNILYAAQHGVLMFRLTLKRTRKTHEYGHGKIGGLHTVEYRGIKAFFRGRELFEVIQDLHIQGNDPAERGINLYKAFVPAFAELTGEDIENVYTLRNVYTIGGAARRKYLNIKYGTPRLPPYHKDFFQTEEGDNYFRQRKLLLSGMCFFPEVNHGKLIKKRLFKYDVNGLYSFIANNVGALGQPQKSDYTEFRRDKSGKYAYILIIKYAMLCRRVEMPNCFSNPFTHETGNIIEITDEWAVFGEVWDMLNKYYMLEEFEVEEVYKCRHVSDPAIIKYNEFFAAQKAQAKVAGNHTSYMLSKLFLNNICGKMVQNTLYRACVPYYSEEDDAVHFQNGELIDNWERGHFHFVRGAYIYSMARVKVMTDIYELTKSADRPIDHHFYTDTDSIITDMELPAQMVDDNELGKYKVEEIYTHFGVIAPKTYYGYTEDSRHTLTVAGLKKRIVFNEISAAYGDGLTAEQFWTALTTPTAYNMPVITRISGGSATLICPTKIGEYDTSQLL